MSAAGVLRGGLAAIAASAATFTASSTRFAANVATDGMGGAYYQSDSALALGPSAVEISGNRAGGGSAVYLGDSATSALSIGASNTTQVAITANSCTKGGGTVVWTKAPGSRELIGSSLPNARRMVLAGNRASFGNGSATQSTSLAPAGAGAAAQAVGRVVMAASYFSSINPHIVLRLVDHYGAVNISDSSSYVTASVGEFSCAGHPGYLRY